MPGNVAPENNATNVPIIGTSLTWIGGELNAGDVDYQIYIARPGHSLTYERTITSSAAAGQQISFPLGTLLYKSTYSWRIVADDKVNPPVESPVWSFTTTNDNGLYRVLVTAEKLTSQSGGNGCNSSCMSACSKIEVDELINQDYAPNTTLTVSAIASMQ